MDLFLAANDLSSAPSLNRKTPVSTTTVSV